METLTDNLVFPESLRWHNGQLWFVDMYDGVIYSQTPAQPAKPHWRGDIIVGGLGIKSSDDIVFVDKVARKIMGLKSAGPSCVADLTPLGASPLNDLVKMSDGGLYVGEYGYDMAGGEAPTPGNIYYISPKGEIIIAASGVMFGNGLALSEDEKQLYIAETIAGKISVFDIGDDRHLDNRRTLIHFKDGYPDGICMTPKDKIWAAVLGRNEAICVGLDGTIKQRVTSDVPVYDVTLDPTTPQALYIATSQARPEDLRKPVKPRTGKIVQIKI